MTQIESLPIAAGAAAEQPLSDAQHVLRRAIATKSHHERLVAGISERLSRLDGILAQDRQLEAQIRELQLAHQADRALWLENGCVGPEPRVSKELAEARFMHTQLQPDVAAALPRLPALQAEQAAAIEELTTATREVDIAVYNRALEACAALAPTITARLNGALVQIAKLEAVAVALQHRGNFRDDNLAQSACNRVRTIISEARSAAGVPRREEVGRDLLALLAVDPAAELLP
jgi:hypothetical protein